MKKILATLAIAFSLLFTAPAIAKECPPTASYSEMMTRLTENNEKVYVGNERFVRFVEQLNSIPTGFLTQVVFIRTKDGKGFMHIAFTENCLIAQSVFHVEKDAFFAWLAKNGFSQEDFAQTEGA